MSKKTSRVELIKDGSTTVRLYTIKRRGRVVHSVASYLDGKRQLKQFTEYTEAREEAKAIARRLSSGQKKVLSLTDDDAWAYEKAVDYLRPWNVDVAVACREYSQARLALKNHDSVVDAAKFFQTHHGQRPNKTVGEVVHELLQERADRSKKYVNDLKFRLNRFATDNNLHIADVTPQQISSWIRSLKLRPRSQFNFRAILTTLFRYAVDQGYLPEGRTAPEKVKLYDVEDTEIEIFTPDELEKIIAVATPRTINYIVLGAFAGIRTAEILRLKWEDIDLESGFIELKAGNTKTRSRRLVPIADNLRQWLTPRHKTSGPMVTLKRPDESIGEVCLNHKPRILWKRNGLRHSFASYRYAITQNENLVAAEMGNSPTMIHAHYRQVAKPEQARAWFAIVPKEKT